MGGAGRGAGRIETVEAAVGLCQRGLRLKGWMDLGEAARKLFACQLGRRIVHLEAETAT